MSGTKTGGKAAAKTVKELYGDDFYKRIGHIGGKKGTTGGFQKGSALAREAGRKGGKSRSPAGKESQSKYMKSWWAERKMRDESLA